MCLAVPGELLDIRGDEPLQRTGRVSFGGVTKEVSLAFVSDAAVGDYLLVHAGFAISIVDEAEAGKVFDYLKEIDQLSSQEEGRP